MNRLHNMRVAGFCLAGLAALWQGCAESPATEISAARSDLRVRRADFEKWHLMTGELVAAQGDFIVVPRIPSMQTTIKWIETDGATVAPGQKVVELDNSAFAINLEEKRLSAAQAEQNLAKEHSKFAAEVAEKRFELDKRRLDLEKARVEASVPQTVIPLREYQDRQLALSRAQQELRKAEANLAALDRAVEADLANLHLELEKTRGDIALAEQAIQSLELRAPGSGIMVVNEHPWEGRKLQVGDNVWVGLSLVTIPDLRSLQVVATLPDVDDGEIKPGMTAGVTLDAYPDQIFPGKVMSIAPVAQEPAAQSLRRGFRVILDLDRLDTERMRPGLSVKVKVKTDLRKSALIAPRAALDFSDAKNVRAGMRDSSTVAVKVGPCSAQECVIEDGLREGSRLARAF